MDLVEDGLDFVAAWSPPQFDISGRPSLSTKLELEPDPTFSQNFVRAAKWYVNVWNTGSCHDLRN